MRDTTCRIEGYWAQSAKEKNTYYPWPVADTFHWNKKRKEFITKLTKLEYKAQSNMYKGWSTCRLCKRRNGSGDYTYKKWTWPDGLRHYVVKHKVLPSVAFIEFVLQSSKKG